MAGLIYVLDTVTVSQWFVEGSPVLQRIPAAKLAGHELVLCAPVHYEILRGLLKTQAMRKLELFRKEFLPLFEWVEIIRPDWEQAARLWADAVRRGRQLSDMDFLIAAIAIRLDATLVSADADFDVLPVRREDWRSQ